MVVNCSIWSSTIVWNNYFPLALKESSQNKDFPGLGDIFLWAWEGKPLFSSNHVLWVLKMSLALPQIPLISFPTCTDLADDEPLQIRQLQSLLWSVNPCPATFQSQEQTCLLYMGFVIAHSEYQQVLNQYHKPPIVYAKIACYGCWEHKFKKWGFRWFGGVFCFRACLFFLCFLEKN